MRELPTPPVLLFWLADFGHRQHAFVGRLQSVCERQRFTAKLERDPTAEQCPECVHLVRIALNRGLDQLADDAAALEHAYQRLRENAMSEALLIHAKGGLRGDD